MKKILGYVIKEGNVSPCGAKVAYGDKEFCQIWQINAVPYKGTRGRVPNLNTTAYSCTEVNVVRIEDKDSYNKETYNGKKLYKDWEYSNGVAGYFGEWTE